MTQTQEKILRELLETGAYVIEGPRDKSAARQLAAAKIVRFRQNHLGGQTDVIQFANSSDGSADLPREVLKLHRAWLEQELEITQQRIDAEL